MDKLLLLQQIEFLKGLVSVANQYAAEENRDPLPSLRQIHNGNITIALAELERQVRA